MTEVIIIVIFTIITVIIIISLTATAINAIFIAKSKKKSEKKLQEIFDSSPYRNPKPLKKPDTDFLSRDKEKEMELEESKASVVMKYDPHNLDIERHKDVNQTKIVGIAEPKGFWSKFVTSQKLGYIISRISTQDNGKGFWVNLIKAQSMSQGKDQSRGR